MTKANTVPYELTAKFKACRVKLLPASAGTGLKAGSSVRQVLELAGYENVLSKIIGSNNKLNNVLATLKALTGYKYADHFNALLDSKNKKSETEDTKGETKKTPTKKTAEKKEDKKEEKKVAKKAPAKKSPAKKEVKEEKKAPAKKAPAKKVKAEDKEEKKAE